MRQPCSACEASFESEQDLLLHLLVHHEVCATCENRHNEHLCISPGANGVEIDFCRKAGSHISTPRLCESCKNKHEHLHQENLRLAGEMAALQRAQERIMHQRAEVLSEINSLTETRLQAFCNHNMPKDFCPSCQTAQKTWEREVSHGQKIQLQKTSTSKTPEKPKRQAIHIVVS